MPGRPTRRAFIAGSAATGFVAVAGCTDSDGEEPTNESENGENGDENGGPEEAETYEVWALDQGTDTIYTYEPADGEDEFENTETIDLNALEGVPDAGVVPHMIHYSSDYEYAVVACTAGARTLVFRTADKELVANLETGAGSHFAGFSPDDEYIHVDAIGEDSIVRVEADLDAETFEIAEELHLPDDPAIDPEAFDSLSPICHSFTHEGKSYHTLGPSYNDAGLVIVDHEAFAVDTAFTREEVPTNCGTIPHPTDSKFYLTAGLPAENDEDGVGEYYIFDTTEDQLIESGDTGGVDAHGFWFTPDGEELWVLNRQTNDGLVLDPETDEVIDEIDAYGPAQSEDSQERDAPDIMWSSPDGEYMFVTLRGPAPLSGSPHAATGITPGVAVIDIENRETVTVIEPDPIDDFSDDDIQAAQSGADDAPSIPDFHAVGVRPLAEYDTSIPNSPPY